MCTHTYMHVCVCVYIYVNLYLSLYGLSLLLIQEDLPSISSKLQHPSWTAETVYSCDASCISLISILCTWILNFSLLYFIILLILQNLNFRGFTFIIPVLLGGFYAISVSMFNFKLTSHNCLWHLLFFWNSWHIHFHGYIRYFRSSFPFNL